MLCKSCLYKSAQDGSANSQVFDYDWGLQDDFMGAAQLDLTQLDLGHPQDITLELKDSARPKQHLGEIYLTATLWPKNQHDKEQVLVSPNNIYIRLICCVSLF